MPSGLAGMEGTVSRWSDPSFRSEAGLHAVSFFLADALGVAVPFVSNLLAQHRWRYGSIGLAVASISLGVALLQAPVGVLADRVGGHRTMLAVSAVIVGACFGLLPLMPLSGWIVVPVLFLSGAAQACFYPLKSALALNLAGHDGLSRLVGTNLSWNHLGNIASALGAMLLARWGGLDAPLYAVGGVCLFAAVSALLIVPVRRDRVEAVAVATDATGRPLSLGVLCRNRRILLLGAVALLYSCANSPMMTTAALYVHALKGTPTQVAALVLVSQAVMVPLTIWAGRWTQRWGGWRVLMLALLILPIRGLLFALTADPRLVVAIQVLDGIVGGLFGVASIAVVAEMTRELGLFNSLNGLLATVIGLGSVISPILVGALIQRCGFALGFVTLAAMAVLAALLFGCLLAMDRGCRAGLPTRERPGSRSPSRIGRP